MAMTVGGKAEDGFEANLQPDQTYKVGVRAYKAQTLWEEPKSTGSESGTGSASGTSGTNQTKKEVAKY